MKENNGTVLREQQITFAVFCSDAAERAWKQTGVRCEELGLIPCFAMFCGTLNIDVLGALLFPGEPGSNAALVQENASKGNP